jgi:AcrR family transcriptional regulator
MQVNLRYGFRMKQKLSTGDKVRSCRLGALVKPRATRSGGRSARVRASVLAEAFAILSEKGLVGFTIGEVAARAGVHETSIYRRWKSKTALINDALLQFTADAVAIPNNGSLRSDLIELLVQGANLMQSPQGTALLTLIYANDPYAIQGRRAYWRSRLDTLAIIFERAKARGEIPDDTNVQTLLEILIAPLYFRALVTMEPIEDWPIEHMIDYQLKGLLVNGCASAVTSR